MNCGPSQGVQDNASGISRVAPQDLSREELIMELAEARRQVEQLLRVDAEHQAAQKHFALAADALKERVKEINCMYSISEFAERQELSISEVIQLIVDAIPPAWQYPEVTCSRVVIDGADYRTTNFAPTGEDQRQVISVGGETVGHVEVRYLAPRPPSFEGPFLREERSLINAIASRIGEIIEKRRVDAAIAATNAKNRALLAANPDLIVQIDADGRLLDFHVGDYTALSALLSGIVGKNFGELFGDSALLAQPSGPGGELTKLGQREEGPRVFERKLSFEGRAHHFEIRLVRATDTTSIAILRDITQRKRLEREILGVSGREQRRIGRDLHDGLCQHLAGIGLLTQALARKIRADNDPLVRDAEEIVRLIDDAISLAKDLTRGLLPVRLETDGLESGLLELAEHARRLFGVTCRVHGCKERSGISPNVALHVYRIAQEALNNATKHGHASEIDIGLTAGLPNLKLWVKDNGTGFRVGSDNGAGMGLGIMRYRALMIGGTLNIDSDAHGGTTVTCRFPASVAE
jgi:signal transduction histidine kinase